MLSFLDEERSVLTMANIRMQRNRQILGERSTELLWYRERRSLLRCGWHADEQ